MDKKIVIGIVVVAIIVILAFNVLKLNLAPKADIVDRVEDNVDPNSGLLSCESDDDCDQSRNCKLLYEGCSDGVSQRYIEGEKCIGGKCRVRILEYCDGGTSCSDDGEYVIVEECREDVEGEAECKNMARYCGIDPGFPPGECLEKDPSDEPGCLDRHYCG